jgi:hypothetical protein
MKKILLYLVVALASLVAANYFTSCNVVNKSRSVEKKSVDSTTVKKSDSGHTISKDSTVTKTVVNADSTGEHHKKEKQITVNFDTAINYGNGKSYDYSIGGTHIKSPQKIKSAVIDDNSEDETSTTHKDFKKDSLQVKLLDSSTDKKLDSTHLQEQSKTVLKTKESKRTSPWLFLWLVIAIIVGGYFGGKKLGFFK